MSEKCKTQDVAEVKNASARSCIISNKWKSPVRREYGERTKTTIYSITSDKNTQFYAIYSIYPFSILMLKMSMS